MHELIVIASVERQRCDDLRNTLISPSSSADLAAHCANTSFDTATHLSVHVGYFLSASIDLIGLFHLFVPAHLPTVDAGTGTERR